MPTCEIKFTFDEHIEINEELAEKVNGLFEDEILEEYEYEDESVEFLEEYIEDLKKCNSYSTYEGTKRESAVAKFPAYHESDELGKIFGLKILEEEWNDEGSDRYYFYTFVSQKEQTDGFIHQMKKNASELRKKGIEVKLSIDGKEY